MRQPRIKALYERMVGKVTLFYLGRKRQMKRRQQQQRRQNRSRKR